MVARPLMLCVLLLAAPLTGCIGSDGGDEELRKQRAEVTEVLGGVEGIVTDDAFQPVVGADVTIAERDVATRTASDGSFAFSRLVPGVYTVVVQAEGFVSASQTVTVVRGEAAQLDFVVTHLFTEEAYETIIEKVGFLECGYAWKEDATGQDLFWAAFAALAVCAVPSLVTEIAGLGSNATNDRFLHPVNLDPPLDTVVYEMDWVSNNPTGDSALWSVMEVYGWWNARGARIINAHGPPPLYVSVNATQWQGLQQNFTDNCEEGNEDWCGYAFFEDGWEMGLRVFASWGCNDLAIQICPQFQQEFTHYVSGFYNAPAPEGYSIVQGTSG